MNMIDQTEEANRRDFFDEYMSQFSLKEIMGYIPFVEDCRKDINYDEDEYLNKLHNERAMSIVIEDNQSATQLKKALEENKPKVLLVDGLKPSLTTMVHLLQTTVEKGKANSPTVFFLFTDDSTNTSSYEFQTFYSRNHKLNSLLAKLREQHERNYFSFIIGKVGSSNFEKQINKIEEKKILDHRVYIQDFDNSEFNIDKHILSECINDLIRTPNSILYIQSLGLLGNDNEEILDRLKIIKNSHCGIEFEYVSGTTENKRLFIGTDLNLLIAHFSQYMDFDNMVSLRSLAINKRTKVNEALIDEVKLLKEEGMTQKKIAEHLKISVPTVARIYQQLKKAEV